MSASTGATELRSVDPATLELVGTVPVAAEEEIAESVARSREAQRGWAATSFAERGRVLGRAASAALDAADEIASTVTAECGKPLLESYTADLFTGLDNLLWSAANAPRLLHPERIRSPLHLRHKRSHVRHEPFGVVAVISPWNFPFATAFAEVASALAAGNGAVVKPSELTPLCGGLVARVYAESGVPEGLVGIVQGGGVTGAALVRAPGVAKVFFTGSSEVGRDVAAAAGSLLRPVTLELGGKDPMLVLEDADLDRAVDGALWGSFSNCGQVCAGIERIYVARPVFEPFVEELSRRAGELRIGPGRDPATDLGPLVSESQRDRAEALVADALDHGAEARTGARRPNTSLPGWFYEPTVLTGARGRIEADELFGPVVTVAPVRDEDEAVRLANDSPYGLGASVWTRDPRRARRLAERLDAGSVWANDVAYSYGQGQATWGGVKESGYGRTHGKQGLLGCTQVKFVGLDRGRVPAPWWFPYGPEATDGFRGLVDVLYRSGVGAKTVSAWRHRRGLAHLGGRYLG